MSDAPVPTLEQREARECDCACADIGVGEMHEPHCASGKGSTNILTAQAKWLRELEVKPPMPDATTVQTESMRTWFVRKDNWDWIQDDFPASLTAVDVAERFAAGHYGGEEVFDGAGEEWEVCETAGTTPVTRVYVVACWSLTFEGEVLTDEDAEEAPNA